MNAVAWLGTYFTQGRMAERTCGPGGSIWHVDCSTAAAFGQLRIPDEYGPGLSLHDDARDCARMSWTEARQATSLLGTDSIRPSQTEQAISTVHRKLFSSRSLSAGDGCPRAPASPQNCHSTQLQAKA